MKQWWGLQKGREKDYGTLIFTARPPPLRLPIIHITIHYSIRCIGMLESSLYPLLALKVIGTICPCFVKEEDCSAVKAAWALSSIPIRWHRKLRRGDSSSSNNNSRVGGFLSSMLNSSGGGGSAGDTYEPLDSSTLSVIDSPSGPQLVVSPPSSITSSLIKKKRIPLKIIKTVKSHRHVKARKGGRSRSGIEILDNTGRELIIFDVLQPRSYNNLNEEEEEEEGENVEDADEATRDEIIDQLEILIEWERRRQSIILTLGEEDAPDNEEETVDEYDDDNDDDDIGTPTRTKRKGVLAEKAASIKHFAQREIEMQKLKKERENRKAKYVKEAGGLKYTAIAMANRS